MTTRGPSGGKRIPLPRLVVGILLHFCVPAYLIACLVAAAAVDPPVAGWPDVLPRMGWTGAWFVPAFLLLLVSAAVVASLLDRHVPADDPAATARDQLAEGRRALARLNDRQVDRACARLDAIAWDWREQEDRRLAADLHAAARTFVAAAESATAERRPAVLALAAESAGRLAMAGEALAAERGRLDEGDARTVAGYLATRYGD